MTSKFTTQNRILHKPNRLDRLIIRKAQFGDHWGRDTPFRTTVHTSLRSVSLNTVYEYDPAARLPPVDVFDNAPRTNEFVGNRQNS